MTEPSGCLSSHEAQLSSSLIKLLETGGLILCIGPIAKIGIRLSCLCLSRVDCSRQFVVFHIMPDGALLPNALRNSTDEEILEVKERGRSLNLKGCSSGIISFERE